MEEPGAQETQGKRPGNLMIEVGEPQESTMVEPYGGQKGGGGEGQQTC